MNAIEKIRIKNNVVRAVIYARFSSDNQREESITAQLRAVKEYARRNDILIVGEYIDKAKSATTDNRPEFLKMIADSKKENFDVVLVHKLDRFARNRYDSIGYRMELKRHNVSLVSILEYLDDESPEGMILESVLEAMAEYFSKNLAREVNKGMKETALKGQHAGGLPPLGYDVDPITKKLIINDREANAVRLIYKLHNQGVSYKNIARELNLRGYNTKKGAKFVHGSLNCILRNEKYIGTYIFNKSSSKDIDGKRNTSKYKDIDEIIRLEDSVPEIISKGEFELAQEKIEIRKVTKGANNAKEQYLLSGKIKCGVCGGRYIGNRSFGGRNKSLYITYRCNTRKRDKDLCNNKEIRRKYIEKYVLEMLAEYIFNEKLIPKLLSKYNDYKIDKNIESLNKSENLKNRLNEIKKETDNLLVLASKVQASESLANKLLCLETEKKYIEEEYEACCDNLESQKIGINELTKSFYKAKKLVSNGQLSFTKRLVELFIDEIKICSDYVGVVFRYNVELFLLL